MNYKKEAKRERVHIIAITILELGVPRIIWLYVGEIMYDSMSKQ